MDAFPTVAGKNHKLLSRCEPAAAVLWGTQTDPLRPHQLSQTRHTTLIALSLLDLQGQVQSTDGKVDCLRIHSSNLLGDSKESAALSPIHVLGDDNV